MVVAGVAVVSRPCGGGGVAGRVVVVAGVDCWLSCCDA